MRPQIACTLAIASLTAACASTVAPVREPPPPKRVRAEPPREEPARAGVTIVLEHGQAKQALPPGVTVAARSPDNRRTPVEPTALDLAALPVAAIPKPLEHTHAPKKLPPSQPRDDLRIEPIDTGYRSRSQPVSAVYVVVDAKMARLQIGTVASDRNASDRVYRTCSDKYYSQPVLTPARWETLTIDEAGTAEYRVVDAWFDAQSCEAAVVKETVIHPKPVLGGLMFAFQSKCDECFPRHAVTFLAPALTQLAAGGVGGKAQASHGKFSIVELPVRRGGAASFTGTAPAHALKPWLESTTWRTIDADVMIGAEITQAVPDRAPQAIAYATLVTR